MHRGAGRFGGVCGCPALLEQSVMRPASFVWRRSAFAQRTPTPPTPTKRHGSCSSTRSEPPSRCVAPPPGRTRSRPGRYACAEQPLTEAEKSLAQIRDWDLPRTALTGPMHRDEPCFTATSGGDRPVLILTPKTHRSPHRRGRRSRTDPSSQGTVVRAGSNGPQVSAKLLPKDAQIRRGGRWHPPWPPASDRVLADVNAGNATGRGPYSWSSSASTSSERSTFVQTFCTSSLSSSASTSLNTLRAPSTSTGTLTEGWKLASADS